jgi:hypothetical protein
MWVHEVDVRQFWIYLTVSSTNQGLDNEVAAKCSKNFIAVCANFHFNEEGQN